MIFDDEDDEDGSAKEAYKAEVKGVRIRKGGRSPSIFNSREKVGGRRITKKGSLKEYTQLLMGNRRGDKCGHWGLFASTDMKNQKYRPPKAHHSLNKDIYLHSFSLSTRTGLRKDVND